MTTTTESFKSKVPVLHLTTVHKVDDVRIFQKQCLSLHNTGNYQVQIAARGVSHPNHLIDWIPLNFVPENRYARFLVSQFISLKLLITNKAIIWHIHDPELIPIAILAKLFRKRKIIWDAHEDYLAQLHQRDKVKRWIPQFLFLTSKGIFKLLFHLVDRLFDGVIAPTPFILEKYSVPFKALVGNEAKISDFTSAKPKFSNKAVLFLGEPSSVSMFEEVVEATRALDELTLFVAGRKIPDNWDHLQQVLGQKIQYLGWLDTDGLLSAISNSSIGLVTYCDSNLYENASPTKYHEFSASGLPIVATPNPMNQLLMSRYSNGVITLDFTSTSIQLAIQQALSDEQIWMEWSRNGKLRAQEIGNWNLSEARLIELYSNILSC